MKAKAILLVVVLLVVHMNVGTVNAWQLQQAPLMTDWASQVDPNNTLPEYPRPQMVRSDWLNLNGSWQFQQGNINDPVPIGQTLSGDILVPYPVESAISGVMQHYDRMWYKRYFDVPTEWSGKKIILHFGAVDWEAEVYINGTSLGIHRGGFDEFSYDITPYLDTGSQELIVRVFDDTGTSRVIGKQSRNPGGIFYSQASGIWQTVWIEPVAETSINDMVITPDIDTNSLKLTVNISGPASGITVNATAKDSGVVVGTATGNPGTQMTIKIPVPKLWSPDTPFLYGLDVSINSGSMTIDTVTSYFGMRKIQMGMVDGVQKILLNNKFVFQMGTLDQGYWPDGIYTAPTDEALKWDLEQIKALGFNMVRKHAKVEPARWYYWTDKLGLLVWQDMPQNFNTTFTSEFKTQFEYELQRLVKTHYNYPSIIMWTLFNEGWGDYDVDRITNWVMGLDPTRLVNAHSGANLDAALYCEVGHIKDNHFYPEPGCDYSATRATVSGEYGGIWYRLAGHEWHPGTGHDDVTTSLNLMNTYENYIKSITSFRDLSDLSAAVYTQIIDVEEEENGLITYDRKVIKVDVPGLRALNQSTYKSLRMILSTSQKEGVDWKYTFTAPASDWYASGFNDSAWNTGMAGFGTSGTPGAIVRTTWNMGDIWMRKTFNPGALTQQQIDNLIFLAHNDENVEIYINGVLAASAQGYTTNYRYLEMNQNGKNAIIPNGSNIIAIHCRQTVGGQYIDVGIGEMIDLPLSPTNLYEPFDNTVPVQLTGSNTAAEKFTATNPFNAIDVSCPSWSNNIGNLTLKLFVWNTDYNTTVNGIPIAIHKYSNFVDNALLRLDFSQQAPGTYLWLLDTPSETVGVWKCEGSTDLSVAYFNGSITTGDYRSRVFYTEKPQPPDPVITNLFTANGNNVPVQLTGSNTAAERFTAAAPFTAVAVSCPSWSNDTGTLLMKLFRWNSDYNTTVNGTPVYTKEFVNYTDNEWNRMNFQKLPAGEYMWVMYYSQETVGVWKYEGSTYSGQAYLNGAPTTGDYCSRIHY